MIAVRNGHIVVVLTAHLGVSSAGFKGVFVVSIWWFALYVPEPRKVATVVTISMNYSWDWFLIFVSLPSPFWTFLVSVLI